jgi:hypothetical protein
LAVARHVRDTDSFPLFVAEPQPAVAFSFSFFFRNAQSFAESDRVGVKLPFSLKEPVASRTSQTTR